MNEVIWHWTFYGFVTAAGNRPVQEWFDGLTPETRDELRDIFAYLQKTPNSQWGKPEFAPLGEGIFEIRYQDQSHWYRIYSCYWPEGVKQAFTLLHGTTKKVRNDADGKKLAEKRRAQLRRNEAAIFQFNF